MSERRYKDRNRSTRKPFRKFQKRYEEKAIVLDVLSSENIRRRDIAKGEIRIQAIGTTWFTLLEVTPDAEKGRIMVQELILLNRDVDSKISKIVGRIEYQKLSNVGERGIERAIETIINTEEKRFITWINQAEAISIRLHKLQLIKGIGPKFMSNIISERKLIPFTSYSDFEDRTKLKDIRHLLKQRILQEIKGENIKYNLFTRAFSRHHNK